MTEGIMTVGYGAGVFLLADVIGNLNTAGHNVGLEFMASSILLFAGALAHLARKAGN